MSASNRHLPDTTSPDSNWRDRAACIGSQDAMFPDSQIDEIKAAKAVCGPCPVKLPCLVAAFKEEGAASAKNRYGIRGGCTPSQRHHAYEDGVSAEQLLARHYTRTAPTEELLRNLYETNTTLSGDGHLIWTGTYPSLSVRELRFTAGRLAFQVGVGREPDGQVQRTCDRYKCVLPSHLTDRAMREQQKASA
ncbi:WhiB family transcriptional regulator [Streptomyces sp. NPDC004008]